MHGLVFGSALSAAGFADLWIGTNRLAAVLGLFTLLSYLLVYTPLKQRSSACTTVGAIPGAMPPLIGFAAAGHAVDTGALALFLILFVWQFPHFDAIAWMYREGYACGGIRMLPVIDLETTARLIMLCSLLLIPISLVPRFAAHRIECQGKLGRSVTCSRCRRIYVDTYDSRHLSQSTSIPRPFIF